MGSWEVRTARFSLGQPRCQAGRPVGTSPLTCPVRNAVPVEGHLS